MGNIWFRISPSFSYQKVFLIKKFQKSKPVSRTLSYSMVVFDIYVFCQFLILNNYFFNLSLSGVYNVQTGAQKRLDTTTKSDYSFRRVI